MSAKAIAAVASAAVAIAGACERIAANYSVEIQVTRIWGENEAIPERVAEAF